MHRNRNTAGTSVYTVGDEPTAFYVVANGEVVRDYQDGSEAKAFKVGSYFGEVGMLVPDSRCFATIKSKTDSTLLTVSKADFGRMTSTVASSSRAAMPTVSGTGLTPRPIERNLKRTLLCELLI